MVPDSILHKLLTVFSPMRYQINFLTNYMVPIVFRLLNAVVSDISFPTTTTRGYILCLCRPGSNSVNFRYHSFMNF